MDNKAILEKIIKYIDKIIDYTLDVDYNKFLLD